MNLVFVTSFGTDYYDKVASHTLPYMVKATEYHQLMVYYENEIHLKPNINQEHVSYHNLYHCSKELMKFLKETKDNELYKGMVYEDRHYAIWNEEQKRVGYNYRLNAFLFCRKWFSIKCAYEQLKKRYSDFVLCWLDADLLFYDYPYNVEDKLTNEYFSDGQCIAFLDRDFMHSECGLMFFKRHEIAEGVINFVCNMYSTHKVFELSEWQDCFVFDTVRESFDPGYFSALALGHYGEDVFSKSFFHEYCDHLKGCLKKDIEEIIENARNNRPPE